MGMAYIGMSSAQGAPLLSEEDIGKGLAAPLVAQKLLGTMGEYAILFLILMAVMSTGSAEVRTTEKSYTTKTVLTIVLQYLTCR